MPVHALRRSSATQHRGKRASSVVVVRSVSAVSYNARGVARAGRNAPRATRASTWGTPACGVPHSCATPGSPVVWTGDSNKGRWGTQSGGPGNRLARAIKTGTRADLRSRLPLGVPRTWFLSVRWVTYIGGIAVRAGIFLMAVGGGEWRQGGRHAQRAGPANGARTALGRRGGCGRVRSF